jgi:hypothetical protein
MAGEIDLTLACAAALVTEAKIMTMKARAVAKKRAGFFERGEGVVARGACNIEVFLSESVQVAFSLLDGDQAFSRHKPAAAFRVPRNCGRGKSKAGKYGNSVCRAEPSEKGRRAKSGWRKQFRVPGEGLTNV